MDQYRDEHINCADCGAAFLFSAGEAAVFAERGLASPKRCKDCRRARKERGQQQPSFDGGGNGYARSGPPQGGPRDFRGGSPRPQGRPDGGGYSNSYGNSAARSPRYTGDVNEYRSPMQDNGYAASPAPWSDGGYAPRAPRRPAPGGPRPGPRFQGGPPAWQNDGQYRAPSTQHDHHQDAGSYDCGGPPPGAAPRRRPQAEMFSITCNSCGIQAEVPFRPAEGRDVFCQACYRARKPV